MGNNAQIKPSKMERDKQARKDAANKMMNLLADTVTETFMGPGRNLGKLKSREREANAAGIQPSLKASQAQQMTKRLKAVKKESNTPNLAEAQKKEQMAMKKRSK